MPEIHVLVGMIASGKSTYAAARAREGFIVVNDDAIVNAVHGDDYTLYDAALKPLYKSTECHILHAAVGMGRSVLVDRGLNVSRNARQRYVAIGRSLDVPVHCVLFQLFDPEVHARRRAESDARGYDIDYWLKVALAHRSRYDAPSLDEGFASIIEIPWSPGA